MSDRYALYLVDPSHHASRVNPLWLVVGPWRDLPYIMSVAQAAAQRDSWERRAHPTATRLEVWKVPPGEQFPTTSDRSALIAYADLPGDITMTMVTEEDVDA